MSDTLRNAHEVHARIQEGRLEGVLVQEVDLSKKGLANAQTADATFRRVALHDADASDSVFARTRFTEASCRKARFDRAIFRGAAFFSTELIEATFRDASLSGTSFFSSRLGNADFSGSRIQSCTFNGCELFGARFGRALILNSRFEAQERGNVTLDRADFSHAVVIDSDLMGANLYGANFRNALLIKVDLRHANLAGADFEGARLIDVAIDPTSLEAAERRLVERARLDDPWRNHGFMRDVLAQHSPEELHAMLEYVLRTYVIETAQTTESSDSMTALLQTIKARYDFPELEHLRVRNNAVQARFGAQWVDLGTEPEGPRGTPEAAPTSGPSHGSASGLAEPGPGALRRQAGSRSDVSAQQAAVPRMDLDESPPASSAGGRAEAGTKRPAPSAPPPRVEHSNRFSNLEID
jgi:uncharacterized protein YjbI with pentapeptide repeats